jgi:dethiobiotin synthetase
VVLAGTATEVGKTWVGAAVATELRARDVRVGARKPAQSFDADDPPEGTDAAVLGAATGEPAERVCPPQRWYPIAMAPPMASDALDRGRVLLADLLAEVEGSWGDPAPEVGLVELAGGVWSPIAHDGDGLDLTKALAPDVVVLVADAGLGTINAVRPAAAALSTLAPVVTLLNRFDADDELHRRNLDWLREHDGLDVATSVEDLTAALVTP